MDESSAMRQLNPSRLQDQVFASTVADQVVDMFNEVGLPYILRFVESIYDGISRKVRSRALSEEDKQQQQQQSVSERDWSETEKEEGKREFLERVRSEVALPPYDLVDDYSEMITQFGYVVLWSTIWPLAPGEKITQISYLVLLVPPPLLFLYFIFGWLD
jgi:anoctamin-10